MDDEEIYRRGGDEHDVAEIARQNGADLTEEDFAVSRRREGMRIFEVNGTTFDEHQQAWKCGRCGRMLTWEMIDQPIGMPHYSGGCENWNCPFHDCRILILRRHL